MTLVHALVVVSLVVNFAAMFTYLRDTIRGTTKPNRATWFMWALAPLVASGVAYGAGADPWITAPVFFSGFWPLVIFLFSFTNREGYWRLTRLDWLCGALSFLAFLIWLVTKSAEVAIILAILSDFLASVPTLTKLWKYPETETKITFVLTFVSFVFSTFAIRVWSIESAAFQIYLLAINFALMFAAYKQDIILMLRGTPVPEKM
jgi:hypothetical protein